MMSYDYEPLAVGRSISACLFQTSTFVFERAEDGKAFFEVAYGLRRGCFGRAGADLARINNPDLEILEDRLGTWRDGAGIGSAVLRAAWRRSTTFWDLPAGGAV